MFQNPFNGLAKTSTMSTFMYSLLAAILLSSCTSTKTTPMENIDSTNANVLTADEKTQGWQLLFDGTTTSGWHTYGKTTMGKAWKAENGTLRLDAASKKDWQTA